MFIAGVPQRYFDKDTPFNIEDGILKRDTPSRERFAVETNREEDSR